MVSDWLKTQKKPPRTNQIRAVLATEFKKMAMVFSRRRRDLILYAKQQPGGAGSEVWNRVYMIAQLRNSAE